MEDFSAIIFVQGIFADLLPEHRRLHPCFYKWAKSRVDRPQCVCRGRFPHRCPSIAAAGKGLRNPKPSGSGKAAVALLDPRISAHRRLSNRYFRANALNLGSCAKLHLASAELRQVVAVRIWSRGSIFCRIAWK